MLNLPQSLQYLVGGRLSRYNLCRMCLTDVDWYDMFHRKRGKWWSRRCSDKLCLELRGNTQVLYFYQHLFRCLVARKAVDDRMNIHVSYVESLGAHLLKLDTLKGLDEELSDDITCKDLRVTLRESIVHDIMGQSAIYGLRYFRLMEDLLQPSSRLIFYEMRHKEWGVNGSTWFNVSPPAAELCASVYPNFEMFEYIFSRYVGVLPFMYGYRYQYTNGEIYAYLSAIGYAASRRLGVHNELRAVVRHVRL